MSGLATSVIALVGVWVLSATTEFNIMGFYLNKILPVGAIGIGLVASSGYGLAAWKTGLKMTRSLVLTVCALLVGAYFAAQYVEFRSLGTLRNRWTGERIGFLKYFDVATRSFAWKSKDGVLPSPLGLWGYGVRALELIGFALGGLIVPGSLRSKAFCDGCQLYMTARSVGFIPASMPARKINKKDQEGKAAYETEQQEAIERGRAELDSLMTFVNAGDLAKLLAALAVLEAKEVETLKLPAHITLKLVYCKRCDSGRLEPALQIGSGENGRTVPLGSATLPSSIVSVIARTKD